MKNIILIISSFITLLLFVSIISCKSEIVKKGEVDMKGMTPPDIKEPTKKLELPKPLSEKETKLPELKQDTTRFAYRILVDNTMKENISAKGIITGFVNGKMDLKTAEGKSMQLNYFIPAGKLLTINKGDTVDITSSQEIKGATVNKLLKINNSQRVIISAGIQTGKSPIKINISRNIILQQEEYNKEEIISDSKYGIHYNVPLYLIFNGQKKLLKSKGENLFEIRNIKYVLNVKLSDFSIPKKEYEGVAEGQGYYLNYLLIAR